MLSKAEKTREFIIHKAAPVFNKKGYAGTSLTDLIQVTGLTKGAIYGNFENKDEVAVAVYQYNTGWVFKKFVDVMNEQESATGKLIAFTNYYRTNWQKVFERGGCPVLNASVEADDNLPFLKKHVQTSIKKWAQLFTEIIETGKQNGEFKKNISAMEYAYSIITLIEGGIMLFKIENDRDRLFAALDRIVKMVNEEMKK